jgi:hypothetical protein
MSTKDYFTYFTNKSNNDLYCLQCGNDIQYVSINEIKDHYRCSNKECTYHCNGSTVSKNEYPSTWVKTNVKN